MSAVTMSHEMSGKSVLKDNPSPCLLITAPDPGDNVEKREGLGRGQTTIEYNLMGSITSSSSGEGAQISKEESDRLFSDLKAEVNWNEMWHNGGLVPRLVSLHGQIYSVST